MKQVIVIIFVLFFFTALSFAAPGDLDLSFNGTGKATVGFGIGTPSTAGDIAVQSNINLSREFY